MVPESIASGTPLNAASPTVGPLLDLVGALRGDNPFIPRGVRGMAIIRAGFVRATEHIDLLVDVAPDNVTSLRQALRSLPDRASRRASGSGYRRRSNGS